MENFQVPEVIRKIRTFKNPDTQMTLLENNMPVYIGRRERDEQPVMAGHRNNEEEITYGRTQP